MSERLYLSYQLTDINETSKKGVMEFEGLAAADAFLRDWLTRFCGVDCYRAGQEEALCKVNGGALPELAFVCPALKEPSDLEGYNGFYSYDSYGTFHLFVMAVYDEKSAMKFKGDAIREYELNKTLSEQADEMVDMLDLFVQSFREPTDCTQALAAIDGLIKNDGLPLF